MKYSLIIPVAPYRDCEILDSIKKLNYDNKKYEIIIEEGYNPSKNRNRGAKKSKGKYLVFLDDDAILDKEYLNKADDFFYLHPGISVVGGPQLTPLSDKFFAKNAGYAIASFFGSHKMAKRYKRGNLNLDADEHSLTSANIIFKKEVFDKIPGFNPKLFPGEDPELLTRIKKNKFKIAYSSDLIIYHRRRPNMKLFCKQHFLYGKVRMNKEKFSGSNLSILFLIPSAFLIYFVLIPFLYSIHWLLMMPLGLYIVLAIMASIQAAVENKDFKGIFLLPFLFLMIHLSYGAGMIAGLLKR